MLSPIDRISEILFGLIMALTFTCTISVIDADHAVVRDMLIGALGCNIAWGLVDAVMYLLMTLTEKERGYSVFRFVKSTSDTGEARDYIRDAMPPVISERMTDQEVDGIRKKLLEIHEEKRAVKLTWRDLKISVGIFFLVFLSTFPVAFPFLVVEEVGRALRLSNGIAIAMMFLCGWALAKFAGINRFIMGLLLSLVGVALVAVTIALGG